MFGERGRETNGVFVDEDDTDETESAQDPAEPAESLQPSELAMLPTLLCAPG
jgi:hypothetical protein